MTLNAMTIDVEDWFHILDAKSAPDPREWDALPSRLERNTDKMLEILADANVRATLFWLGWAAERFPKLVKKCHDQGHEVASHGQNHLLCFQAGREKFFEDVDRSKKIIEEITGAEVLGYRAPGFSFTPETPWAHEVLAEAGYTYSSSIFPAARGHGGFSGAPPDQYTVDTAAGPVEEFPITTVPLLGKRLCLFGGGYLRITPLVVLSRVAQWMNDQGKPIIYYLHPREIDTKQPKMWRIPPHRFFKYYVNLWTTEGKMRSLLKGNNFAPLSEWLPKKAANA